MADAPLDDKALAAIDLIGRTGAKDLQIRYSDDSEPVVWMAMGSWPTESGPRATVVAAALNPTAALLSLCEKVIDGALCLHCGKPAVFLPNTTDDFPFNEVCRYQYDPELKTFRRECEGEDRVPEVAS